MSDSFDATRRKGAFHDVHPLEFDIVDQDEENVLSIRHEGWRDSYLLRLKNVGCETLWLGGDCKSATDRDFQLMLRFRPQTLKIRDNPEEANAVSDPQKRNADPAENPWTVAASIDQIAVSDPQKRNADPAGNPWKVSASIDQNALQCLTIRRTAEAEPIELKCGETLTLELHNIDVDGGARGTRVEFRYSVLRGAQAERAEGTRLKHVSIVNAKGRKVVPLRLDLPKTRGVVNDGKTQNELTLTLTNEGAKPLPFLPAAPEGETNSEETKFFLYFDVHYEPAKCLDRPGRVRPWAIATIDQVEEKKDFDGNRVGGFNVNTSAPLTCARYLGTEAIDSQAWEIKINSNALDCAGSDVNELLPGESLTITIGNIVTDRPTGPTRIFVHYENVPGYRDGTLEVMAEKSPLIFANTSCVGIGTNDAKYPLQIASKENGISASLSGSIAIGIDQNDYANANECESHPLIAESNAAANGGYGPSIYVSSNNYQIAVANPDHSMTGAWVMHCREDGGLRFVFRDDDESNDNPFREQPKYIEMKKEGALEVKNTLTVDGLLSGKQVTASESLKVGGLSFTIADMQILHDLVKGQQQFYLQNATFDLKSGGNWLYPRSEVKSVGSEGFRSSVYIWSNKSNDKKDDKPHDPSWRLIPK